MRSSEDKAGRKEEEEEIELKHVERKN